MARWSWIVLLAALTACAAPGRHGPPPAGSGGPGGASIDALADRLGLTEQQEVAVSRILADDQARIEAARAQSRGVMRAELAKILTDAQLAEFDQALLEGLPGVGRPGSGGRRPPPAR